MHGGELRVETPSDGGTRFLVRLPRGMNVSEAQVVSASGA
jgi:signal transduction histidine kinase